MADPFNPFMIIAVGGGAASLGSALYTLWSKARKRAGESVTIVIRRQDGSEVRLDNVPRSAVADFERQAEHNTSH